MTGFMKFAVAAALSLGGLGLAGSAASAAPMIDSGLTTNVQTGAGVEKARIVCDAWGRCWRTRPRYYAPYYAPPRFYGGPRYGNRHHYRPHRHHRRW